MCVERVVLGWLSAVVAPLAGALLVGSAVAAVVEEPESSVVLQVVVWLQIV